MLTLLKPISCILLVDDDDTTNFVNMRLLRKMNIAERIEVAKDGSAALEYLNSVPKGESNSVRPELMLVDIKMSGMDGFEFLERYKDLPLPLKADKLVMLSSSASFYDLHKLQQFNDVSRHISKPLSEELVWEILKEFFQDQVISINPAS
jgi:CheY-like chemotaxis protein